MKGHKKRRHKKTGDGLEKAKRAMNRKPLAAILSPLSALSAPFMEDICGKQRFQRLNQIIL